MVVAYVRMRAIQGRRQFVLFSQREITGTIFFRVSFLLTVLIAFASYSFVHERTNTHALSSFDERLWQRRIVIC